MGEVTVTRLPAPSLVRQNWLDRAIGWVSPERAARRLRIRAGTALAESYLAGSGYVGGRSDRGSMQEWHPFGGSPDADTLIGQADLRARSRDLTRNSAPGAGTVNTAVTGVIGTGLNVQPTIDRELLGLTMEEANEWQRTAKRIWKAAADNLDIEGELTFSSLQTLIFRSVLESGDVLPIRRFKKRPGDIVGTKIQIIEADRISNPGRRPDDRMIGGGVEIDRDGRVRAYHVQDRHPGDILVHGFNAEDWKRVPAWASDGSRMAKLLFDHRRPGQRRGVPYLAPVIEPLKQLERFLSYELAATVVSAMFTVFIKTDTGDDALPPAPPGETPPTNEGDYFLNPGAVVGLAPGEEPVMAKPERPNVGADAFVTSVMRHIGMAVEIPYEVLIKHFGQSYSAARAAILLARRFFEGRRTWLNGGFNCWCYESVISEAVATGLLRAPGFFDDPIRRRAWLEAKWIGDTIGQIDPNRETRAAQARIDARISSRRIETELIGHDPEVVNDQVEQERLADSKLAPADGGEVAA